jgi:hypothetical protein
MTEPVDLANTYRQIYRNRFKEDVLAGEKTPFFFHICFLGIHVIPALYLAIPHKRRPWLYQARWLVLAVTVSLQIWFIRNVSSTHFVFAYGSGMLPAWGIIWNLTLLVWTRPQWDAKRVERVRNPRFRKTLDRKEEVSVPVTSEETHGLATGTTPVEKSSSGVSSGAQGNGHVNGGPPTSLRESNGHAANGKRTEGLRSRTANLEDSSLKVSTEEEEGFKQLSRNTTVGVAGKAESDMEEDPAGHRIEHGDAQEYIYEWQEFPEKAPFMTRLDWAFDIATTLRLTGKCFSLLWLLKSADRL